MALGLPVVVSVLLSAMSPQAIYTSSLPICDEWGLTDEEAEAALWKAHEDAPPEVTTGARASLWVTRMTGSCGGKTSRPPSLSPSLHGKTRRPITPDHGAPACVGADCLSEIPPTEGTLSPHESRAPFISAALPRLFFGEARLLFERPAAMPRPAPARRLLRPPESPSV